jgi:hypothetical protein
MRIAAIVSLFVISDLWYSPLTAATFDAVINVSSGGQATPNSIGSNTQLNATKGAILPDGFQAGSPDGSSSNVELNFSGLRAGKIQANGGSAVNLTGGTIWDFVIANQSSVVNVSGDATLLRSLQANSGSTVNVSGGTVARSSWAHGGSLFNISGGIVKDNFYAADGSVVNFSGGSQGDAYNFLAGSHVSLFGHEFRLNGQEIDGISSAGETTAIDLPAGSVLSGTLADGTPFAFSDQDGDRIADGTIFVRQANLPPIGPASTFVTSEYEARGIRNGQQIIVGHGGKLPDWFSAGRGSEVVLDGGAIGSYFEAVGTRVNVVNGNIGNSFAAFDGALVDIVHGVVGANFGALNGSLVKVTDGRFGEYFHADAGSRVVIADGTFDRLFSALGGSHVTIRGGEFGERFYAFSGSDVTIDGGSFGDNFRAYDGSAINLRGTEFYLDGVPIVRTTDGNPIIISDRNVTLTGRLTDGSLLSFELSSTDYEQNWRPFPLPYDYFSANSALSVTLVPEPDWIWLGFVMLFAVNPANTPRRLKRRP